MDNYYATPHQNDYDDEPEPFYEEDPEEDYVEYYNSRDSYFDIYEQEPDEYQR